MKNEGNVSEKTLEALTENQRQMLLQLCIAEYQALTTRASYWIVLQIGLLPVVPVYLVLAVTVWQSGVIVREVVAWTTLVGLQMIALLWSQALLEQFAIVKYIECYLRTVIDTLTPSDSFWGYEPFLVTQRPMPASIGFFSIPGLVGVVFTITVICRLGQFSRWDLAGMIVNGAIFLLVGWSVYKAKQLQKEWSEKNRILTAKIAEHLGRREEG
jgi:hypothetical protein